MACMVENNVPPIVPEDEHHPSLFITLKNIKSDDDIFPSNPENTAYDFGKRTILVFMMI
nr:unnamed protein product [Callosobruchus chinensis]